jgi:NAD(P)-dependent dehydrogenase (short-subunit alcohol dehydrogenase family)
MTDQSRVAVVTGASSGIGKQVAKALAAQGWRIIGTGRDPGRSAAAEAEICTASTTGEVELLRADLSLMVDAARLARDIAARTDRVDLLVNNAGGMCRELVMTAEGFEENFAANHLGPFLLTERLLPLLRAAAKDAPKGSVRILMTASDAGEMIPGLNLDDMENLAAFSYGLAYCSGKLANIMFARTLGQRLAGDGITAHAVHPGAVESNFFTHAPADTQERAKSLSLFTEEDGADTLIWLATDPAGGETTGGYWFQRQPRKRKNAEDAATLERFWKESEKLVARAGV